MRRKFGSVILIVAAQAQLMGCATPFNVADPTTGISVPDVLKSLKCEMITFIEANRQQRERFGNFFRRNDPEAYQHPYIDLADDLFAGVYVELKEVDIKSLNIGFNRISRLTDAKSLTLLAGPSATGTDTFEVKQNFALLQSARLHRPKFPNIAEHRISAPSFDCYNDLPPRKDLNFQEVSADEFRANFKRIKISFDQTLSQWLQNITTGMSKNYLAAVDNKEILAPGQISYSFMLDYKVAVDGKYELIAQIWNPLSVAPSASLEKASTFRFIFNTNYAPVALGADGGLVGVTKAPCSATQKLVNEDCTLNSNHGLAFGRRRDRISSQGGRVSGSTDKRTDFDRKNNPDVFYTLPLGIPLNSLNR